jgi:hypothetical protein
MTQATGGQKKAKRRPRRHRRTKLPPMLSEADQPWPRRLVSSHSEVAVAAELQRRMVEALTNVAAVMTEAYRSDLILTWDALQLHQDAGGARYLPGAVQVVKLVLGQPTRSEVRGYE